MRGSRRLCSTCWYLSWSQSCADKKNKLTAGKDSVVKGLNTYGYTTAPEAVASCAEQTASRAANNDTDLHFDECAAAPSNSMHA